MSAGMISDHANGGHLLIGEAHDFKDIRSKLAHKLLEQEPENHGKWQQLDVSGSDLHKTHELLNTTIWYDMPKKSHALRHFVDPDLPWAENHFQERVGGKAINPGVEHANWPYHAGQVKLHQNGGKYDHNYMERFWPTDIAVAPGDGRAAVPWEGYRFAVGDLNDVIKQLKVDPGTRQAYLPIFFPEDTGATEGQRVPCTLGYHFIVRDGLLHMTYNMRSCEIYRHFTNDVYMACRLAEWVAWNAFGGAVTIGQLTMNIVSLHGFVGDTANIEKFTQ